jgi:hypothetical protein
VELFCQAMFVDADIKVFNEHLMLDCIGMRVLEKRGIILRFVNTLPQ